jgi:hypothetical protein
MKSNLNYQQNGGDQERINKLEYRTTEIVQSEQEIENRSKYSQIKTRTEP